MEADRDPQNIWDPRKVRESFVDEQFRALYIVGTLTNKANLIAFPLTPKHVTLNDLEWPFCVKFCLRDVILTTSTV